MRHGAWFSIFVPRFYNSGRPIAEVKLRAIRDELIRQFDGLTLFEEPMFITQGFWQQAERLFEDRIRVHAVFAEDINSARAYLEAMKPQWQRRFRQKDVFIVEMSVEVM